MAQTAEEKGFAIVQEADKRDTGWQDSSSTLTMTLTNRHGDQRLRKMRSRALEVPGDGDKRLIIFDYPPDMRGTGFLTFSHRARDDDQWLYLPSLKRVRRIASGNKSNSFMGSEFAYEDIAAEDIGEYSYRWLHDEACGEHSCFVVESFPLDTRNSGYSRRISWIDQEYYYTVKVDYFDRKGKFLKTLTFQGYRQHLDQYWRPDTMEMINHQNGNSTRLDWDSYRFRTGLKDSDFTHRNLKLER